jgi:6-phosphogluconolactonase/glucosamine-6-phosphate isomerase/deaminase
LKSSNVFLHIQSKEKLKVFKEAIVSKNIYEKPISAVLNQNNVDLLKSKTLAILLIE